MLLLLVLLVTALLLLLDLVEQMRFRFLVYPKLLGRRLGVHQKSKPLVVTKVLKPGEEIEEAVAVVVVVVVAQW